MTNRTTVWKTLSVNGCWLTSPFAPDRGRLDAAWLGPDRTFKCHRHPDVPGARCECGLWGTPSWDDFARWVRCSRKVDNDSARYVQDGYARYSREQIEALLPAFERLMPDIPWRRNVLNPAVQRERNTTVSWRVRATARCSVDSPGMGLTRTERMRNQRPGMLVERMSIYGLTEEEAWRNIRGTDFPDGWFRYPSMRIEELWLSDEWADHAAGLQTRYKCPVNFRRGGAEWIDGFLTEPAGAIPRPHDPGRTGLAARHSVAAMQAGLPAAQRRH